MMVRGLFCTFVLLFVLEGPYVYGQSNAILADSINQNRVAGDSVQIKKNIFLKIKEYFDESNVVKDERSFDMSFIGGPHFSSSRGVGLGLVASGLYRIDKEDRSYSPSNISLYGDVSTKGFYVIGVESNTIFPQEKYRVDLVTFFASENTRYWGVGYNAGREKDNYTEYTGREVAIKIDILRKIINSTYFGVVLDYTSRTTHNIHNIDFFTGERINSSYGGVGLNLSYDTRDFIPNPSKGVYAKLEYIIYPGLVGNRNTISSTEANFRAYKAIWEGGLLAFDVQGIFKGGEIPWNMMVLAGGSRRMRGYYEGQYRDRMFTSAQVELRQHVWRRNGVVAWIGYGNVFNDFDEFKIKESLPSYGIGYRWEFKKRVNVRLDYGIGKGESAFYFNINEAF